MWKWTLGQLRGGNLVARDRARQGTEDARGNHNIKTRDTSLETGFMFGKTPHGVSI